MREETEEDRKRRLEETERQIQQATVQALGEIRLEVANQALLAAEKITRGALTSKDQQRLIDEALAEIDFSAAGGEPLIATAQRIYARALFEAAQEQGALPAVAEELADLARSIDEVPELAALLVNPEIESRVKAEVLDADPRRRRGARHELRARRRREGSRGRAARDRRRVRGADRARRSACSTSS